MATQRQSDIRQEPVGIVISGGSRAEEVPRFTAYVWGPAPDADADADADAGGKMVAA